MAKIPEGIKHAPINQCFNISKETIGAKDEVKSAVFVNGPKRASWKAYMALEKFSDGERNGWPINKALTKNSKSTR